MTGGVTPVNAPTQLLLATTNEGKVRELRTLLAALPSTLLSPADVGVSLVVEETGTAFVENARIKARAYFDASGLPTIAEDSGLEIDALAGEPGVFSARYHGLPDGPIKNAHILDLLAGLPPSRRRCRYVCAIVHVDAEGEERAFQGTCSGRVAQAPEGTGGFGFDPIVFLPRLGRTVAQLSDEEKNRISHRGKAARQLVRHFTAAG
jgi:XTP/dITP diphosphohydrolase